MAGSNFISKHWEKQLQVFLQNLIILKDHLEPDAIHDLRVSVKKLRSYLKLYALIFNYPGWKKDIQKTLLLFSILGKHRDNEINIQLIKVHEEKNLKVYLSLKAYFQANLHLSSILVKETINKFEPSELETLTTRIKTDLSLYNEPDLKVRVQHFIMDALKKINRFKTRPNDAHKARKTLKDIYYWMTIYPDNDLYPLAHQKKINKILDLLGDWQDQEVLIQKVKHFRKDYLVKESDEFNDLKQLELSAKEKNQAALNKIGIKISAFIKEQHDLHKQQKANQKLNGQQVEKKPMEVVYGL